MQASELRIGNLVDYYGSMVTVNSINDTDVGFSDYIPIDYPLLDEIKPIPLTEEWLVRFGGKLDDLETDCYPLSSLTLDYRFYKSTCLDGSFYWTCDKILGDTYIQHVHQLQNLYFALTRTELTLNP